MSLKFELHEVDGRYQLMVSGGETTTKIRATEGELRRLLIDLATEFDIPGGDDGGD